LKSISKVGTSNRITLKLENALKVPLGGFRGKKMGKQNNEELTQRVTEKSQSSTERKACF
jgi:hypothetical protein